MRLFVGLGNPGAKYAGHRHNIGFMAVDRLVDRYSFGPERKKFQALVCEGVLAGEKILTLKPQTFMNESGRAVGEALRFFKLSAEDVTVFYDELDLAPGKIKVKTGGGAAGHNGIRSIISHIGPEFQRVRMGIGHPGSKDRVLGHVLGDFAANERGDLDRMLTVTANQAGWLAKGDGPRFMTEIAKDAKAAEPTPSDHGDDKPDTRGAGPSAPKNQQKKTSEGPLADMLRALKGEK